VAALLLKTDRSEDEGDLAAATAGMEALKGKKSSVATALVGSSASGPITNIVFACDAGMGSSAMGASVLRKKVQGAGFSDVKVTNQSIANLTDTYGLVVTHQDLTARAKQRTPSAVHISVDNFMNAPQYDEIVELLGKANAAPSGVTVEEPADEAPAADVLTVESIVLAGTATTRDAAISEAGRLLVACGAVEPSYVDAMHAREGSVSTYMGNGLAIPHGTNEAKDSIRHTGISFVRYAEPIDWNGKPAEFVVGIAGAGKDHMALLTKIAGVFLNKDEVARLRDATSAEQIQSVLGGSHP
jgi:PTS system mannitol-specific IIC component